MKERGGLQVILVLLGTAALLGGSFYLSPLYPDWSLPSMNVLVQDSVEQIPLYSKTETKLVSVDLAEEDSSTWYVNVDTFELFQLQDCEKIIHASGFENELAAFYQRLSKLSEDSSLIRVLHFGDSQIEGDRITGVLRSNLQRQFGGCGVGFLPISESRVSRTNVRKYVSGWNRYKVFGTKQKGPHNAYGFTGYYHRTMGKETSATVSIRPNHRYFKECSKYEQAAILYRVPEGVEEPSFSLVDSSGKGHLFKQGEVRLKRWNHKGFDGKTPWRFTTKADSLVDFYGVSLEGTKGISVANVAMRGSSGIEFTRMNAGQLKAQMKLLEPSLIVYQFGINVIPFIMDDYKFYETMVYSQLKRLKSFAPNACVLVVGVSDMAKMENGEYISFPNIEAVKKAQKNAAKKAGCAFWDLHQVMGGENAMKEWVVANPPLAEKDYTHFNRSGAKLVGKKLFEAIMADYFQYQRQQLN